MSNPSICTIKMLPQKHLIPAAKRAIEINPANAPATHFLRGARDVIIPPLRLALLTEKRWSSSGVRLTVGFLDNPPADLKAHILSHMNAWGTWANVQFVETATDPQVRIARGKGYWSYLGTDILQIAANQPTMNLESFTMNTPESVFRRVVRHETGHTLGFPHEHMRQEIVDRIDREKAIAYFMKKEGWSRKDVIDQVLTPLSNSALIATAQADINSIMCYWLPASIMKDGVAVVGGTDIDNQDAQFVASVYPYTVSAIDAGHYKETGTYDANNKIYMVGSSWAGGHRNFFVFDLTHLPFNFLEAGVGWEIYLEVYNPKTGFKSPQGSERYVISAVTTPIEELRAMHQAAAAAPQIYAGLGTGKIYGYYTASPKDNDTFIRIPLYPTAHADIQRLLKDGSRQTKYLAIGGRIASLNTVKAGEYLFALSRGIPANNVKLVFIR